MSADELALLILMTCLLAAHGLTLHLLRDCGRKAAEWADNMTVTGDDFGGWMADSRRDLTELCAIGTDLADYLEALSDGLGSNSPAAQAAPQDPLNTILSLITGRMAAGLDGSTTEPEWAIHQQQADEAPLIDLDDDGTPTAL